MTTHLLHLLDSAVKPPWVRQGPETLANISVNPLGAPVGVEEVSAVLLVTSQQGPG